ncbi:MAG: putative sortase-sorted surface protein [Pseudonocardiales bacterium]|nr:putative sortase-sorted surface protein [Pseudonocardiales bacterium]
MTTKLRQSAASRTRQSAQESTASQFASSVQTDDTAARRRFNRRYKFAGAGLTFILAAAGSVAFSDVASANNTAGAGSAPLGSTAYAVPAGALYVSPSGSDSAAGTSAAPLKTVNRAVAVASSGKTVVLKSGTYHESVTVPSNKTINFQSAAGAVVYFDGSSVVSGWTQSGATWIRTGWTAKFDPTPSYDGTVLTQANWGFVNPAYPMASHPDQLWVDGTALTQVASAAAVKAGTFYSDYSGNRIVLGTNPSGHEVRASDLGIAMTVNSANSSIRGIGFRRYATAVPDMGAIRVLGANAVVENDIVSEMATTGISMLKTNQKVTHVTLMNNGMLGMHANNADGIVVSNVLATNNNLQHFNTSPVAGGIKMSRTRGVTVRNSVLSNNIGTGLWLDESTYNAVVVGNVISNNQKHGISYEISATALIADNIISGSASDAIKINDSANVRIWNNTLSGNTRNIEFLQDSREYSNMSVFGHDTRQKFPDPTMTWKIGNSQVMNNKLSRGGTTTNVNVRDYTNKRSTAQMGFVIDGNLFTRTTAGDVDAIMQAAGAKLTVAKTVSAIAATGVGSHNAEVSLGVATANAATVYARPLPADIAAIIGRPAGIAQVGAF